jgi:hypothetical protein
MNLNQKQQPAIDISQTFKIACECGHSLFEQSFALRKVSALVTGTGQEAIIPIQLFTCKECGTILKSTIPPELKGLEF